MKRKKKKPSGKLITQNDPPARSDQSEIARQLLAKGVPADEVTILVGALRYRGPIPPPSMMAEYKTIQADFPERIMREAEANGAHRRDTLSKVTDARIDSSRRDDRHEMNLGFALTSLFLVCGTVLLALGQAAGFVVASGSVLPVALTLLKARQHRRDREQEKGATRTGTR